MTRMKTIWFIYPYGPIPSEKTLDCRYVRFGKVLSKMGYNCVWWTANFSHGLKTWRSKSWETIDVCDNLKIELVPSSAYKKNISLGRVLFEMKFASNLGRKIRRIEKPDIIMTSGTGLFTAFRPVWPYMKKANVPVIFDIMDVHLINTYMQKNHKLAAPFVKLITMITNKREEPFYKNVAGVSALGRGQLKIAKERTGNRDVPSCLVYNGIYVDEFREVLNGESKIALPEKKENELWCIYAGSLGPSYDIETIIECADICEKEGSNVKFIFAGMGPYEELVEKAAQTNSNVVFVGRLSHEELITVYKQCDVGLATYTSYSTVDMPDKFYDYCAAGMAIINSLQGEVKDHIAENELGLQYEAGSTSSLLDCIMAFRDTEFLNKCKKNAYDIGDKFDLKNQIAGLAEMINKIIGK